MDTNTDHFTLFALHVRVTNIIDSHYTRKMVPIPRRARSFLVVVFIHVNRKEEEGETE